MKIWHSNFFINEIMALKLLPIQHRCFKITAVQGVLPLPKVLQDSQLSLHLLKTVIITLENHITAPDAKI